jgi:hypothetical protein
MKLKNKSIIEIFRYKNREASVMIFRLDLFARPTATPV